MSPHIIRLAGNRQGKDYITTDIHGCVKLLEVAHGKLTPGDRLMITGDLFDRGPDSFAVMQFIQQHRDQIHVIRGNHEDLVLKAIGCLQFQQLLPQGDLSRLQEIFPDKAEWISFLQDSDRERVLANFKSINAAIEQVDAKCHVDFEEQPWAGLANSWKCLDKTEERLYWSYLNAISQGGQWLLDLTLEQRQEVADFIGALPYLIKVDQVIDETADQVIKPYVLVHADCPLSDVAIEQRLAGNAQLTDKEIWYATWARQDDKQEGKKILINLKWTGRNEYSDRVFCGHSPFGGARAESNSSNQDLGAFQSGLGIVVNYHDNRYELISAQAYSEEDLKTQVNLPGLVEKDQQDALKVLELNRQLVKNKPSVCTLEEFVITLDKALQCQVFADQTLTTAEHKANYLQLLKQKNLSLEEKSELAHYLLANAKTHSLAKERHPCWQYGFFYAKKSHSLQTASMHQAIQWLLKGHPNYTIQQQKHGCFSKKLVIIHKENQQEQEIATFTRSAKVL